MNSAADTCYCSYDCHPERSLAVSKANRQIEWKDARYQYTADAAPRVLRNE